MNLAGNLKLSFIGLFLVAGFGMLLVPKRASMDALLARMDDEFPNVRQISTSELARSLAEGESLGVFDVRTREEFEASHLPGAKFLDASSSARNAVEMIRPLPATNILYCSVGFRAAEMAELLMAAGHTNVVVLRGSIFKWAGEGRGLESVSNPPLVHPHSYLYTHLVPMEQRLELPGSLLFLNHIPRAERYRISLGAALLLFLLVWESLAPAYRWFSDARRRFSHGWRNYLLGFINVILAGLFFVQLWIFASKWADARNFGLLNAVTLPAWLRILIAVVVLDAWTYGWHWLNHRISFLWRFHRTHHTETQMDVTSAVRFHFGEIVMSGLLRVPLIILLGLKFKELLIYETLLFTFVQFHHANIRLPAALDRFLSLFIVSPGYHRVHHSTQVAEANSNFSSMLTIWDRLFRTRSSTLLTSTRPVEGFGVKGMIGPEHHTVVAMVESPLQ
jgi:sterol desaturase/sphingolipid hydroxylase (fatty acid hydroxylase superfamily)/rhodanese-related sulfurtransferase